MSEIRKIKAGDTFSAIHASDWNKIANVLNTITGEDGIEIRKTDDGFNWIIRRTSGDDDGSGGGDIPTAIDSFSFKRSYVETKSNGAKYAVIELNVHYTDNTSGIAKIPVPCASEDVVTGFNYDQYGHIVSPKKKTLYFFGEASAESLMTNVFVFKPDYIPTEDVVVVVNDSAVTEPTKFVPAKRTVRTITGPTGSKTALTIPFPGGVQKTVVLNVEWDSTAKKLKQEKASVNVVSAQSNTSVQDVFEAIPHSQVI